VESADLDFGAITSQASAILPVTVTNSQVGDAVLVGLPAELNAVASQGTLTMDTQPTDGDTMTIGGVTYTWLDTFVDAADNIFTGADLAAAKVNALAAIMATGGTPGTTHYTSQVKNPDVFAIAFAGDDMVITAEVPGTAGDTIATTETFTPVGNVFDAATLGTTTAGADSSGLVADGYVSAEHTVQVRVVNAGAATVDPVSGNFDVMVWQ
jgi:hypothetical protein